MSDLRKLAGIEAGMMQPTHIEHSDGMFLYCTSHDERTGEPLAHPNTSGIWIRNDGRLRCPNHAKGPHEPTELERLIAQQPAVLALRSTFAAMLAVVEADDVLREFFATADYIPRSCGACGTPNASCDADCAAAAHLSRDIGKARRARAALREAIGRLP